LNGLAGLNDNYKRIDPEKRSLETEIKQLPQLVGKLSLELEFKNELLKKILDQTNENECLQAV
jgi:hypothetical protein